MNRLSLLLDLFLICLSIIEGGCFNSYNFGNNKRACSVEVHIQHVVHKPGMGSARMRVKINDILIFDDSVTTGIDGLAKIVSTEVPEGTNKIAIWRNQSAYAEKIFSVRTLDKTFCICVDSSVEESIYIKLDCQPAYL